MFVQARQIVRFLRNHPLSVDDIVQDGVKHRRCAVAAAVRLGKPGPHHRVGYPQRLACIRSALMGLEYEGSELKPLFKTSHG
jgi:hypothetical protein